MVITVTIITFRNFSMDSEKSLEVCILSSGGDKT
jgi:hypothetical protein